MSFFRVDANTLKKRYYKHNKMWVLDFEELLKYNDYLFILRNKILREKLINKYYNNLLMRYFGVTKTYKLFAYKYY